MKISRILTRFLDLLYPKTCSICELVLFEHEKFLCLKCLAEIPKTNYHLIKDNPVEQRFWGKVSIENASAFFFFQKGSPFQAILHQLKYKGNKNIGIMLGKYAAADLYDSSWVHSLDFIVPVPLHPNKLKARGYNQSEQICIGMSEILNKPIEKETLIRIHDNTTQTKKSVFERYENTSDIFQLTDFEVFKGKHVLLVDDVLTTGATLEACMQALMQAEKIKLSVFCLAIVE